MYIMLLKMYCSSFSAVAASTFNWPMIEFIQNKVEMNDWTAPALKCDQQNRKGNMENKVWKYMVESIVHSIWKEYENYIMSLLIPK